MSLIQIILLGLLKDIMAYGLSFSYKSRGLSLILSQRIYLISSKDNIFFLAWYCCISHHLSALIYDLVLLLFNNKLFYNGNR